MAANLAGFLGRKKTPKTKRKAAVLGVLGAFAASREAFNGTSGRNQTLKTSLIFNGFF